MTLKCTAQNSTALHCTALHCIALHCTTLHCTALHCTAQHCTALLCIALHYNSHCTVPYLTALDYTSLLCSTLSFNELYFLFWTFRHNTWKVMAKQAIFTFGLITIAVFVQTKGNLFQTYFFYQKGKQRMRFQCCNCTIPSCLPREKICSSANKKQYF